REAGAQASFAAVAEQLRMINAEFDPLIAEIAADGSAEIEVTRLELAGAVRKTKMKLINAELEALFQSGTLSAELAQRYRELKHQQEILQQEEAKEAAPR